MGDKDKSRSRSRSKSKESKRRSRSRKRSRSRDRKKRSRSRSHKKKSKKERRSKSKESKKEIKRDYDQEEAGYEQKEEKKDPVDMEISNSPKNGTSSISTGLASRNIILSFYDNILAGLALFVGKMHKKHLTCRHLPGEKTLLHCPPGSVSFKSKVNQIFLSNMRR